jgi:hypothetical protein
MEPYEPWYCAERGRCVAKKTVMRLGLTATLICLLAGVARAQNAPDLAGRWTLNPTLTQGPKEIGFGVDWATPDPTGTAPGSNTSSGGGGRRGGRGGGGGSVGGRLAVPFPAHPESEADAQRVKQLSAEAREPSPHLTIASTPATISITTDHPPSRTFHPDAGDEVVPLDGVDVNVNARREAGKLVLLYQVEEGRQLRYTYTRVVSPLQLVVEIQFIGRGGGDQVKYVYEPEKTSTPATTAVSAAGSGQQPFNQQPDAELKGITKMGVVVEGISEQAKKCGVQQDKLESSVTKHLVDAGFTVPRNSDEDTYVYVNIQTASLSNGYCVSRYDATVYTHTTTPLSYQKQSVLVEVSLMHKGGLAGGAPAEHADGVMRGVLDYIDGFITRIRDANKATH